MLALTLPLSTAHIYAEEDEEQNIPEESVPEETNDSETNEVSIPEQPVIDENDPEGSNEKINEYNEQVDEYNNYVDEYNQQVDENYDAAYGEYEEQLEIVEQNNAIVDQVETQIEEDSQILDNVGEPTDWTAEPSEEPKTIAVEEAEPEDKAGETVSVINVHVYLNEDTQYTPNELYDFVEEDSFKLSDELVNSSVLIEYETAEIDYNDTVTTSSEAEDFAGNIVVLNGQRKWFGADPKPYFFRSLDGYTQGYWTPGGSIFMSTATEEENGWSAGGETYTAQYAEKETTQNYLYNGELMSETITTRTTDKQKPRNIFSMFTYLFVRLFNEPERMDEPEVPIKEEYLEKLDKMDLIEIKDDPTPEPEPSPSPDPEPTPEPDPEPTVEPEPTPTIDPEPAPTPSPLPEPEPESDEDPIPDPIFIPVPDFIPEPEPIQNPVVPVIQNVIPQIITPVIAEEIEEEPVPAAAPTEIEEPEVPLAAPVGSWALINLITTILSVIIALGMLLTGLFKKTYEKEDTENDEEDNEDKGKHKKSKVFGILPAVLSVILFIMTEDIRLPMVLIDKWTIPMVIILIISIILAYLTRNKKKEDNDEEEDSI